MGAFFCNAFSQILKTEFCIINPGMLRIDFRKGPLTYDLIFQGKKII